MAKESKNPNAKEIKKVSMRPHSFSMEPGLYHEFMRLTRERGLNGSAVIRRLMMMQMKAWVETTKD